MCECTLILIIPSACFAFWDELRKKVLHNLPPSHKSVAALPCEIWMFHCMRYWMFYRFQQADVAGTTRRNMREWVSELTKDSRLKSVEKDWLEMQSRLTELQCQSQQRVFNCRLISFTMIKITIKIRFHWLSYYWELELDNKIINQLINSFTINWLPITNKNDEIKYQTDGKPCCCCSSTSCCSRSCCSCCCGSVWQ